MQEFLQKGRQVKNLTKVPVNKYENRFFFRTHFFQEKEGLEKIRYFWYNFGDVKKQLCLRSKNACEEY